jgi:hypothetical protein
MKSKVLLLFTLLTTFFTATAITCACPIWYTGKFYVVDENGNSIQDVKVYKFLSVSDSFKMTRGERYKYMFGMRDSVRQQELDSTPFEIWSGGGWYIRGNRVLPDYKFKFEAKGYADLWLKDMNMMSCNIFDTTSNCVSPVLYITMPKKKYKKVGAGFTLVNKYYYNNNLAVKDTVLFSIFNEGSFQKNNKVSRVIAVDSETPSIDEKLAVVTYPNPVVDQIKIMLNEAPKEPKRVRIFGVTGNEIISQELTEVESKISMDGRASGMYIIRVYDENGFVIHDDKLVKR